MKKLFKKSIACLIAVLMVVSTMPFTAVTASAADEVEITGAVQYGPVIFTHGTNTVSTDYNFMMKGTQIAAGDVVSATDCKTTVTVASGVTINSVSCVEDAGAQLTVSNNLLTGSFSTNKDDTTVTLKTTVTYNGKTYVSYNKVYVDTIPVPAHAASMSQRYYGVFNPSKSINAYSQTLKGSLGQNSTDGSSSTNQVKANAKELYVPGTTVRFDNKNDTNHWRLTHNITIDKVAGYTGYQNTGGASKGTTTLTTVAPTGNYYYDKSTTNNYGFSSQNGNSFSFELITIPFKIVTGDNADSGSVNLDTHKLTGDNFTQSDPYTTWSYSSGVPSKTKFTNVITGNASSITNGTMTGTYELRFATQNTSDVWAVNITKSNWNVYVADKSATRNPYKTANSSIKTADIYTADSWSAYKSAYLNAEAFLANYKNTADSSVQTNATTYGNALTSAYTGLTLAPTEYTVTFKYYDNTTVVRKIDVGNAIGDFPANSKATPDSIMPDLGHNVYYWNTSLTKDSVPTTDVTINESQDAQLTGHSSKTPATCTTKQTCDACGATFGNFGSHTLEETSANDATCTEDGNSAYWTCSDCGKMFSDADATTEITEIPTISASGHSLTKVDEVPSTCTVQGTAAYWTCSACHKMFSDEQGKKEISAPDKLPIADHKYVVTSNDNDKHTFTCQNCPNTYDEAHAWGDYAVTKPATCTENAVETATCKVAGCGATTSKEVENSALGHIYGKWAPNGNGTHTKTCTKNCGEEGATVTEDCSYVDGVCTECKDVEVKIDWSSYENAVKEYNAIKSDPDYETMYSADSIADYEALVDAEIAKKDTLKTQEDADAAAAAIISAKVELVYVNFDIDFVVVDKLGNESAPETRNVNYGDPVTFTKDADNIAKWIVKTQNGKVETKVATSQTTYTMIATEPATVYVYLTEEKNETLEYSKVSFISKNGAVSSVQYVAKGTTIETSEVQGDKIPFYDFVGWNKASVTADGSDIEVKAVYKFVGEETNKCNVHYNDTTKTYTYDSFVYLFGAEGLKLALATDAEGKDIITYLNENAFYAPHRENIYVIVVDSQPASIGITGSYMQTNDDGTKTAAFNCKFYVPDDIGEVVEYGMIATTSMGSRKIKAGTASDRGEYCIKISSKEVKSISGQAYLTYRTSQGKLETIYSTTVTQNLR